jgi:hypothetical protein
VFEKHVFASIRCLKTSDLAVIISVVNRLSYTPQHEQTQRLDFPYQFTLDFINSIFNLAAELNMTTMTTRSNVGFLCVTIFPQSGRLSVTLFPLYKERDKYPGTVTANYSYWHQNCHKSNYK